MSIVLSTRLNEIILQLTNDLVYTVSDVAPSTYPELRMSSVGGLVVWSGASDLTIYGDPRINFVFRALHDFMHVRDGLDFAVEHELELARRTAALLAPYGEQVAAIAYAEVGGQVEYFAKYGEFPKDQMAFVKSYLRS